MKNLFLLLTSMLTLVSCNDFGGDFTANQNLQLVHTTVFGNERNITVPAGTYSASFGFSSKDKLKLTLKNGNNDIDIKMKINGNSFPRNNGRIDLPASRTGQAYDITGDLQSVVTYSNYFRDRESCSYTEYRQECYPVCDNRGCRTVCNTRPVTVYGWRNIEYRNQYIDRTLSLDITTPNTRNLVGSYSGDSRDIIREYVYQSPCL